MKPARRRHRLYARARYFYEKRTADSLRRSIYYYRRAIEADPRFGRAFVGLAEAYVLSGEYLLLAPSDAFPAAERGARTALELDGATPEALVAARRRHDDVSRVSPLRARACR